MKIKWPSLKFPPINLINLQKSKFILDIIYEEYDVNSYGGFSKETIENNSIPVTETGCWIWEKGVDKEGYPNYIRDMYTRERPTRLAYKLFNGELNKDEVVRHICDIPSCVNPNHLIKGNQQDNINDKIKRNRWKGNQKLTFDQINYILSSNKTQKELAKELGVDRTTISWWKRKYNAAKR